jgi:BCD family chlorophyll transporter-like MFS transporter
VVGVSVSPQVAFLMDKNLGLGILAGLLAFGAWGMGYNLSAVSYLSLASELSGEKGRGRTVATMFFMMVIGLIATGIALSRMLTTYTPETLMSAFNAVALTALALGLLGLVRLEPRSGAANQIQSENYTIQQMISAIMSNPVARIFFVYLLLLLVALLGQDVLLEPFGAQAFGMTIEETSRLISVSGVFTLIAFLVAGALEGRVAKKTLAQTGNLGALLGLVLIVVSGVTHSLPIFYVGLVLFGFGTGISTVANLSLMFDLTVTGKVGLYIGAWGFSNGLSRLTGILLGGVVADGLTQATGQAMVGYLVVFGIEALMLFIAALMLTRIDVSTFRRQAEEPNFIEKVALAAD